MKKRKYTPNADSRRLELCGFEVGNTVNFTLFEAKWTDEKNSSYAIFLVIQSKSFIYFDQMDQENLFELSDNSSYTTASYVEFTVLKCEDYSLKTMITDRQWTRAASLESARHVFTASCNAISDDAFTGMDASLGQSKYWKILTWTGTDS